MTTPDKSTGCAANTAGASTNDEATRDLLVYTMVYLFPSPVKVLSNLLDSLRHLYSFAKATGAWGNAETLRCHYHAIADAAARYADDPAFCADLLETGQREADRLGALLREHVAGGLS